MSNIAVPNTPNKPIPSDNDLIYIADALGGGDWGDKHVTIAQLKSILSLSLTSVDGVFSDYSILPVITSGTLSVAIKKINGSDNLDSLLPMTGYIGQNKITIDTAKSITLSAGTNWLNLNNSHFRSTANNPFDVDLFVYLVYNTASAGADTVDIVISRIPYALAFSDFDSSSTSNYGRYTNATVTPNSGDLVRVIGRITIQMNSSSQFVAPMNYKTVSAPIKETNFSNWTPAVTGEGSSTFDGTGGRDGRYKIIGDLVNYTISAFGIVGVASTASLTATLPFTTSAGDFGEGANVSLAAGIRSGVTVLSGAAGNVNVRDPVDAFTVGFCGFRIGGAYRLVK